MARKFFYVCAGIFLLALAYHLGAQSARAQGQVLEGPSASAFTASINRVLWYVTSDGTHPVTPPIPGTSPVVATDGGPNTGQVVLANGDCYWKPANGTDWVLYGNLLAGSGPTPAKQGSWGQLKAKYR